jgi:sulfatase modifying factor 1
MPWYSTRSMPARRTGERRFRHRDAGGLVVPATALCVIWLLGACSSSGASSGPGVDCGAGTCDGGCVGAVDGACGGSPPGDQSPTARIRFNTAAPTTTDDYPFSPASLPTEGPAPLSTVYLSAGDSIDPEGEAITFYWNVQDASGKYLSVAPSASDAQVSFSPEFVGNYTIALEAIEVGGLKQLSQVAFMLNVAPIPCAPDGVSAPCADELPLPGGTFMAGSPDAVGFPNEHPMHLVNIAPFLMDKYEVTVGRFRRFLDGFTADGYDDGMGAHPLIPGSGWQSAWNGQASEDYRMSISECGGAWTDTPGASEARPISCVTWYQAFAFCISEGKRLPTEAEWEYAAAGGDAQRTYPWGDQPPTPELAVYGCTYDGVDGCTPADLPVVGSLPAGAGRWGHLDLAGSVWEWTLDVYGDYTAATCDNCANLVETADDGRVFRGGDFMFDDMGIETDLRAADRLGFDAKFPDQTRGLRCARTPPSP